MTKPSPDKSRLIAAIKKARDALSDDEQPRGLSATRRIFPGLNDRRWVVAFDDDPSRFLTVLSSERWADKDVAEIADFILSGWDSAWDDMLKDKPIGDYTVGSSDFEQRNKGRA